MAKKFSEGFLLTTKFYKNANEAALLIHWKQNPEGRVTVQPKGTSVKKQEQMTTKIIVMRKIHANDLHAKLRNNGEDRMCAIAKYLHYSVKGVIEVCKN